MSGKQLDIPINDKVVGTAVENSIPLTEEKKESPNFQKEVRLAQLVDNGKSFLRRYGLFKISWDDEVEPEYISELIDMVTVYQYFEVKERYDNHVQFINREFKHKCLEAIDNGHSCNRNNNCEYPKCLENGVEN